MVEIESDPKGADYIRELFNKIPVPLSPYTINEMVVYIDGIIYNIWEIKSNGEFVLGYQKGEKKVEVIAKIEDFRDLTDLGRFYVEDKYAKGEIAQEKIFGLEIEPPTTEGGMPKGEELKGSVVYRQEDKSSPN